VPFRFIRIYQATADFIEVKDTQQNSRFVPLIAARQSLHLSSPAAIGAQLSIGTDILPSLQQAVRTHMSNFNAQ